jgi:uncharacterized protein YegJ (DUF2314 family)
MSEDNDNIIVICGECSAGQYPAKGKYTKNMLKYAQFVKAQFGEGPVEHIWICIKELEDNEVIGTIANIPLLLNIPKFGTEIRIKYSEIEDAK